MAAWVVQQPLSGVFVTIEAATVTITENGDLVFLDLKDNLVAAISKGNWLAVNPQMFAPEK